MLGVAAFGCGEELGPVPLKTTRVSGIITQGGRPVSGGWVEFLPVLGTVGNIRSAPIRHDGTFVADRVAVGKHVVGVAGAPLSIPLRQMFHPFSSPIRRSISEGGATTLKIDLLEEAIRHQKAQATGN
jgi:hypothetical protein